MVVDLGLACDIELFLISGQNGIEHVEHGPDSRRWVLWKAERRARGLYGCLGTGFIPHDHRHVGVE